MFGLSEFTSQLASSSNHLGTYHGQEKG